jgi:hypothetical protein
MRRYYPIQEVAGITLRGDHPQLEAWQRHVDVLQVVFLGSTDEELIMVCYGESTYRDL